MDTHTVESTLLHNARTRLASDYPDQIRTCLRALNDEQIWWRPNEKANAIGNLVLHLCGSNRHFIGKGIGGRDFERDRAAEFTSRTPVPKEDLLRQLDDMVSEVDTVLGALDPSRLMEQTDRTGKQTTFLQILLHVTQHVAAHMAQIVYATKLLKEGAIEELWMRRRS
jgi:uncharacterized damage-inducible protein DinB